jgi:hypothetical protein
MLILPVSYHLLRLRQLLSLTSVKATLVAASAAEAQVAAARARQSILQTTALQSQHHKCVLIELSSV